MSYVSTVLADAPVHYWRLADPGGLYFHDIGSTPRALQQGVAGVGFASPYTGPNSDGGSAWIGLNSALNYSDGDLASSLPMSLECWFWVHHSGGAAQDFLGVGDGTINLSIGIDAAIKAHAFASGGPGTAALATTIQQWHHLVLTNTAGAAALYLDAINIATPAAAAIGAWHPGFVVGAGGAPAGPSRFSNAAVSECAIYSSALSAARVTAHFVAADNTAARPVYRTTGTFDTTTGGTTTIADLSVQIEKFVSRLFQNAP